jgi:hypothetical protein
MQIGEAQILYDHGLPDEAKRVLFAIYRNTGVGADNCAEALYCLASIAVSEGRFQAAARDFERLSSDLCCDSARQPIVGCELSRTRSSRSSEGFRSILCRRIRALRSED